MENQRQPADENPFERDSSNTFASGPLSSAEREDAKNGKEDEDNDNRWDDELELDEDLDDE